MEMTRKFLRLCRGHPFRRKLEIGEERGDPPQMPREMPRAPAGVRIYAIGDIHGEIALLDEMLRLIHDDVAEAVVRGLWPMVVFLGDYVDRGPDSAAVVERLCQLDGGGISWRFLRGNHEAAMLAFLGRPEAGSAWLAFGGTATLASYGVLPAVPGSQPARLKACRDALAQAMPASHLGFLESLENYTILGDYLFVHAGLRPGVLPEKQAIDDLLSIRESFLDVPFWHGKIVVHGHTVSDDPVVLPWRIGVDTGAYATGRLCCLVVEEERVRFLFSNGRKKNHHSRW